MTTQFPLSGPLSVGDLLDRAFRLYRARFGVFLLTAAIFRAPEGIIFVFFAGETTAGLLATLMVLPASAIASLALTAQSIEALPRRLCHHQEGHPPRSAPVLALCGHDRCDVGSYPRGDSCCDDPFRDRNVCAE